MNILDQKNKQLRLLEEQILGIPCVTGKGKFIVFPIEAALGKTEILISSMVKLYKQDINKKTLIVTRLIDEGKRIANTINKELDSNLVAYAWDSNDKFDLVHYKDFPVLIITHAKFKWLNSPHMSQKMEQLFIKSKRINLIIDEEFYFYDKQTYGRSDLIEVQDTLADIPKLQEDFVVIADKWDEYLRDNRSDREPHVVEIISPEAEEYLNEYYGTLKSEDMVEIPQNETTTAIFSK